MLQTHFRSLFTAIAVAFALSAANLSAQTWPEAGDAPDGVPGRQDTVGVGPLSSITGSITRSAGDHVDTYSIIITDAASFFATTKTSFGGSALTPTGGGADTRLWLWTDTGAPVLGNDDVNSAALGTDTLASLVSDPSTFPALSAGEIVAPTAAGVSLVNGQKYLLSISEFSNDPVDGTLVPLIALDSDFDALHGPNPAAAGFAGWENAADTTDFTYTIALRGATYCVPEPTGMALVVVGGLVLAWSRRR